MSAKSYILVGFVAITGCAKAGNPVASPDGGTGGGDSGSSVDSGCTELCDTDGDGVVDGTDQCPNTPAGQVVNQVGCADSQLTSTLQPFPPFGLTWTSSGDLGRAGGLTWSYVGIQRKDLFHIDWIVCEDPATPCGLSLDGPIDVAAENWVFDINSDLPSGKLGFTNTTHIALADGTNPQLNGRLTMTIVDGSGAPMPFNTVENFHVTPRAGGYGAEITGTGFSVIALGEVQDPTTLAWSPFLDYYDAAPTPDPGGTQAGSVTTSYGGSFYAR